MRLKDLEEMSNRELWIMCLVLGIPGFALLCWGVYGLVLSIVEQVSR